MIVVLHHWWKLAFSIIMVCLPINSTVINREVQRLSCFFYDQKNPQEGMGMFKAGLPSIWAKGLANEDIYVSGNLTDGFFKVHSLKGKTRGLLGLRLVANYQNSETLARHFCSLGLKNAFPETHESKELVHLGVRFSFLSVNYTPVIFGYNNNQLLNKINKIVIFGDSLSDQGNLKRWLRIFPSAPYFAGRFSNHFIWIDYLQRTTGLSVQNWAVAGSLSNPFLDLDFSKRPFLENTKKRAKKFITGHISSEIFRYKYKSLRMGRISEPDSTMFAIWIGGNDYISLLESHSDVDTFLDNPNDKRIGSKIVIRKVTNNIARNIKKLYDLGARNFMVANMPDLGKLPRILDNQSYHATTLEPKQNRLFILSQKMTSISNSHSIMLKKKTDNLKRNLPGINIIYIDVSGGINNISKSLSINDGKSYFDYDMSTSSAMQITMNNQSITINSPCYKGNEIHTNHALVCNEPHRAFFWDRTHPSSYTHCLLAAYIHEQIARYDVVKPSNLNQYLSLCRPDLAKKRGFLSLL